MLEAKAEPWIGDKAKILASGPVCLNISRVIYCTKYPLVEPGLGVA